MIEKLSCCVTMLRRVQELQSSEMQSDTYHRAGQNSELQWTTSNLKGTNFNEGSDFGKVDGEFEEIGVRMSKHGCANSDCSFAALPFANAKFDYSRSALGLRPMRIWKCSVRCS